MPADTVGASATAGGTIPDDMVAVAMQLAIGLLTASLDSAELQAWAVEALAPSDVDGLCDVMSGLHMVCELVLHELHEATGEPPSATLQRLAMRPSIGEGHHRPARDGLPPAREGLLAGLSMGERPVRSRPGCRAACSNSEQSLTPIIASS